MERFLNICAHRQILLSEVKVKGSACLTAMVSLKGFKKLRGAAYKTKTKVRILRKRGLPFFVARLKRRQALILGFILFSLLIFFLTTRVWVIDVVGNTHVPSTDILRQLEISGLKNGIQIWSVKPDRIQTSMLARMPSLSWLWVTVEGTRAVVDVKERAQKPEMIPQNVPCDIIAAKSGLITKYTVKNGTPLVKINTAVVQGQHLVSGTVESKIIEARRVRAEADITAKTAYVYKKTIPLNIKNRVETGSKTTRYSIILMDKEYNLYLGKPCPYTFCKSNIWQAQLKLLNNFYLPAIIRTWEYCETKEVEERQTPETAIEQTKNLFENKLKIETIGGTIVEIKYETANIDENTVSLTMFATCTEQIAKQVAN